MPMLFPKKVKHRKWFTMRQHPEKEAAHADSRGVTIAFGSYGLKALTYGRVTSNQIEADLGKMLGEKRETLRVFRFGGAGAKAKNVKEGRALRRDIARILTKLNSMK